ncbi:MAG: thermonuclease family protein [Candidatus Omnitrophica bacterium]|nr:thermonuclease family protein [Candidatus Omnitrophota bacterium]
MPSTVLAQDTALVAKVIDGKTLELESGEIVRLIGIETNDQAYQYIKKMTEGKTVRLEFDAQQKDEAGRLLAYVYVKTRYNPEIGYRDDDLVKEISLNAEMIKKGYAKPAASSSNVKHAGLFQQLYQDLQIK